MRQGNEYADDDLVERVTAHRIYIVATCARAALARPRPPSPALACLRLPSPATASPASSPRPLAPCHLRLATLRCDRDLKRRLRKIPGVPIISIKERKYQVERMPEGQFG